MRSTPISRPKHSPAQVLYLDFDGVLHHEAVFRSPGRGVHIDSSVAPGRRLFEWTDYLVQAVRPFPQLEIVLSTSWVRVLGYTKARGYLPKELNCRVIGATYHRRFHRGDAVLGDSSYRPYRGIEVLADVSRRRPWQWVALDDTDEGWPDEHRERVVLCDPNTGLGDTDTRTRLDEVLNKHFRSTTATPQKVPL